MITKKHYFCIGGVNDVALVYLPVKKTLQLIRKKISFRVLDYE